VRDCGRGASLSSVRGFRSRTLLLASWSWSFIDFSFCCSDSSLLSRAVCCFSHSTLSCRALRSWRDRVSVSPESCRRVSSRRLLRSAISPACCDSFVRPFSNCPFRVSSCRCRSCFSGAWGWVEVFCVSSRASSDCVFESLSERAFFSARCFSDSVAAFLRDAISFCSSLDEHAPHQAWVPMTYMETIGGMRRRLFSALQTIDFLTSAMQEDAGFVRRLGCLDQLVARAVQLRSQVVVLEFKV
jgi:hypothetical protein